MEPPKKFYRYEYPYSFCNAHLILLEFDLIKETPKGYWINTDDQYSFGSISKKWVSKTATKRYAYPTKKEAMENLFHRTYRYIKILDAKLHDAHAAMDLIKKEIKKEKKTWQE